VDRLLGLAILSLLMWTIIGIIKAYKGETWSVFVTSGRGWNTRRLLKENRKQDEMVIQSVIRGDLIQLVLTVITLISLGVNNRLISFALIAVSVVVIRLLDRQLLKQLSLPTQLKHAGQQEKERD
jgi:uncharacterized membrane protein